MKRGSCLAVCAASLVLGACHGDDRTGIFATVRWSNSGGVAVDQLELTVVEQGAGTTLVAPTLRPAQPLPALTSPQTVAIYLPDALAGTSVSCLVTGLSGGVRLATAVAAADALVSRRSLVPVELDLDAGGAKANGQPCGADSECDSSLCVDGVCCASTCGGLCQSCDVRGKEGICTPVPAGTANASCAQQPPSSCGFDGTCDGNGGCRRYPPGVACAPATCQSSTLLAASACDGQGTCVTPPSIACAPYLCDTGTLACKTSCVTSADCAGSTCLNGSCGAKPLAADGAGCAAGADCQSGICQDGVCCKTSCTASCMACNQAGSLGTCAPVAAGKLDPRGACADQGITSCGTSGLCDGAGACALYAAGSMCAVGTCSGGHVVRSTKQCDGQGACVAAADIDCDPYRCDPTTTACLTSCTANSQCAVGLLRTCQPSGVCQ